LKNIRLPPFCDDTRLDSANVRAAGRAEETGPEGRRPGGALGVAKLSRMVRGPPPPEVGTLCGLRVGDRAVRTSRETRAALRRAPGPRSPRWGWRRSR
jgi:hypothetical protein